MMTNSPFCRMAGLLLVGLFGGMITLYGGDARADIDPVLKDQGWDEILFEEQPPNQFTPLPEAEGDGIQVVSDSTVSVAFLNVDIEIEATPLLKWQWRSSNPDPDTDTTKKGGDDRTLAVYVAFPYQPEHASFGEKVQRPIIEALKGKDTPGRVLTYVWGGGAAQGQAFENPYTGGYGQMVILKEPGAALDTWYQEEVDVAADFEAAFGFPPANPVYVAVGSDTDDTQTVIRAAVRSLGFTSP